MVSRNMNFESLRKYNHEEMYEMNLSLGLIYKASLFESNYTQENNLSPWRTNI